MSVLLAAMALCTPVEAESLLDRLDRIGDAFQASYAIEIARVEGLQAPPICYADLEDALAASLRGLPFAFGITRFTLDEPADKPAVTIHLHSIPPRRKPNKPTERIELEPTEITGHRELPRVMFVVPWKAPTLGDPPGKPLSNVLNEVLKPLDRDEFKREVRYWENLSAVESSEGADGPLTQGP